MTIRRLIDHALNLILVCSLVGCLVMGYFTYTAYKDWQRRTEETNEQERQYLKKRMKHHGTDHAYSCGKGYCFKRNGKEIKL